MHKKFDRSFLYWLIDEYLNLRIDSAKFCDEFYVTYDLELDKKELSAQEIRIFNDLNSVLSRFSKFPEDHALDSKAFSSEAELKNATLQAQYALSLLSAHQT